MWSLATRSTTTNSELLGYFRHVTNNLGCRRPDHKGIQIEGINSHDHNGGALSTSEVVSTMAETADDFRMTTTETRK